MKYYIKEEDDASNPDEWRTIPEDRSVEEWDIERYFEDIADQSFRDDYGDLDDFEMIFVLEDGRQFVVSGEPDILWHTHKIK
jgi:hypothetical protein